jgi:alkanesulfonate monooxygenase SsuD/methylene tetrahydromethanopterin reductase-like flavin-dependent oxidoreductase (luciferase family)
MLAEGGFADDEISMDAFARKVEFVREKAGDRFAEIELNILLQMLVVTDDREAEIARRREEMELEDDSWFESPMVYVGSVEQIVARMQEVRERLGVSYFVVFEPVMEEFAPIVKALAGR